MRITGPFNPNDKAPFGWELTADFFEVIGEAAGDFQNLL